MAMMSRMASALRNLFRRERVDRELDDELRAYVEVSVDEKRMAGVTVDEARRKVLMDLDGLDQVKERTRDISAGALVDQLWRDVVYAARVLRARIGFTAVAVTTLALGIGTNAAIFSVFDAVLLRPLPYRDVDRLHVIYESDPPRSPVNALHFREWRRAATSFEDMALVSPAAYTLSGSSDPVRISAGRATASLFRTLGVAPMLGRAFLEEEETEGRDRVVILGHELWTTQFAADPDVIGRTVHLDDQPHTIVGVLPQSLQLSKLSHYYRLTAEFDRPRLWKPFVPSARDLRLNGSYNYIAFARLKPGVSPARATDELNVIQAELGRQSPEPVRFRAALVPFADQLTGRSRVPMQMTLGAVILVLLIACVNVTNLLLARGGQRQREFAIRAAAGASRARLVVQMLVEGVVLSGLAGALGVAAAAVLIGMIRANAPVDLPRLDEVALDARGMLFTFAITLASGLVIGVLPAWRSTRAAPVDLLRSSSATAAGSAGAGRLRSVLVSSEVAASTVCLVVGGLLVTSFVNLMTVERGFDADRLVTVDLTLPGARYGDQPMKGIRFLRTIAERARAWPGVRAVSAMDRLPLSGVTASALMIEGSTLPRQQRPSGAVRFVDEHYLETMGVALRGGRFLAATDIGKRVAVVSTGTARRLWPGQDPLGKRFRFGPDDSPFVEVVGVVGDVRGVSLSEDPPLNVYVPFPDPVAGRLAIAVRTDGDPAAVSASLRNVIRELDPQLAVDSIRMMNDIVSDSVAARRFQMMLVLLLGAAAVFLAGLGIYGVVSQAVTQRTSEFGIRLALGADARRIRRLVIGQALAPVVAGIALGAVAAMTVSGLLRTVLFGVSPTAVTPIVAASAFLLMVALLAAIIPAWRASRIDPIRALRYE